MSLANSISPFPRAFEEFTLSFVLLHKPEEAHVLSHPRYIQKKSNSKPSSLLQTHTVSKLTLVRIEGLVKIIAIVLPASGLKSCASLDLKMALTSWAVASTASSFSRDQSSTWRKWEPTAGGEMPAAEGGASVVVAAEEARTATTGDDGDDDDLLVDGPRRPRAAAAANYKFFCLRRVDSTSNSEKKQNEEN